MDLEHLEQLEERPPPRERTKSRLRMAWDWVRKRPLPIVALRVYDQLTRRLTGIPVWRYSQITPQLYVGGQHWPPALDGMEQRGIHSIVNLRREFDDAEAGIARDHYLHLPTEDNTALSQHDLKAGAQFIAERINEGDSVYVHCAVGVGRAPTMAAAYLVSAGETPEQAWEIIRRQRPFIWPNRRQRAALRQFADNLKNADRPTP